MGLRPQAIHPSRLHPAFPRCFVHANDKPIRITNQWKAKQQWFLGKFLQPSVVRKLRIAKAELIETPGVSIDKCRNTKFLCKSAKLTQRCGALHEIDKVSLDAPFREKTQGFTRISTFFDAEYLYFQRRWPDLPESDLSLNPVPSDVA